MDKRAVETLRKSFDVDYEPGLADDQGAIPGRLGGARALIVRNRTQVTAALLDAGPALTCVGRLGVGLDNIDSAACQARGVAVYPASGANNLSVAEYVIQSAMMLRRSAFFAKDAMLAGKWPRQDCAGREFAGATLGLVGYGAIARDTAHRARALGCHIVAYDPFVPEDDRIWESVLKVELDDLLDLSDIVSLHVPLNEDTRHLIGADALAKMRAGAVLINAARGGVVDEDALAVALREGRLGGAALDVFEAEPLTAEAATRFRGLENLILTPHIAGVTEESNARVSKMIAKLITDRLTRK